jgi:hypothetical protein
LNVFSHRFSFSLSYPDMLSVISTTERRAAWDAWAGTLQRLGVKEATAWLLEFAGPLTILGAQLLYLGTPLFQPLFSGGNLGSLASLLEDPAEVRAFSAFLRGEIDS